MATSPVDELKISLASKTISDTVLDDPVLLRVAIRFKN